MKFLDLDREYWFIDWQEKLAPVFESKSFINGPSVEKFEREMEEYLSVKHAIGVSSGTDAIRVAMMALMEEYKMHYPIVLTTPYTFISTVEVPLSMGSEIIFSDIDLAFNMDMDMAKKRISEDNIDVVIPVHLFGLPCDIDDDFVNLCKDRGTYIIEDACQSLGSSIDSRKVGTIGDIGCYSFFPSKNLGCAGDGGMVVTNSDILAQRCRMIKNHGSEEKYLHEILGGNFRLDTIQAAILSAKLPYLDRLIKIRRRNADIYRKNLSGMEGRGVYPPSIYNKDIYHTYNQYVIRVNSAHKLDLMHYLKNMGIPTADYYPMSLHEQPCMIANWSGSDLSQSELASEQSVALPIAYLSEDEIMQVVKGIKQFYGGVKDV